MVMQCSLSSNQVFLLRDVGEILGSSTIMNYLCSKRKRKDELVTGNQRTQCDGKKRI